MRMLLLLVCEKNVESLLDERPHHWDGFVFAGSGRAVGVCEGIASAAGDHHVLRVPPLVQQLRGHRVGAGPVK